MDDIQFDDVGSYERRVPGPSLKKQSFAELLVQWKLAGNTRQGVWYLGAFIAISFSVSVYLFSSSGTPMNKHPELVPKIAGPGQTVR